MKRLWMVLLVSALALCQITQVKKAGNTTTVIDLSKGPDCGAAPSGKARICGTSAGIEIKGGTVTTGTVSGVHTGPSDWTSAARYYPVRSVVNSLPDAAIASGQNVAAVYGGINIPAAAVDAAGIGVLGVARTASTNGVYPTAIGRAAEALRGEAYINVASPGACTGAACGSAWGITTRVDDLSNGAGWLVAGEFDVDNGSANTAQATGVFISGRSTAQGISQDGMLVTVAAGGVPWRYGARWYTGCCDVAALAMPLASGATKQSQAIQLQGTDSTSAARTAGIQADENGALLLLPSSAGKEVVSVKGSLIAQAVNTTVNQAGAYTYCAIASCTGVQANSLVAGLAGAIVTRAGLGGPVDDVTDSAVNIVKAFSAGAANGHGCVAGRSTSIFMIRNITAQVLTLTAGAGVALSGTATVAANTTRVWQVLPTNCTAGTEAVTMLSLFSGGN